MKLYSIFIFRGGEKKSDYMDHMPEVGETITIDSVSYTVACWHYNKAGVQVVCLSPM